MHYRETALGALVIGLFCCSIKICLSVLSLKNYKNIKLISEVLKKEVFVLINFYTFFEKEEIIELYKECFYKKIKLLFVENKKPGIINSEEKLFIIDNDLCEINLS